MLTSQTRDARISKETSMVTKIGFGIVALGLGVFCGTVAMHANAAQGAKLGATAVEKDTADKITEVEALRFENKFLKVQQAQAKCEAAPEYAEALKAFNAESAAIVAAHHMDVKPDGSGDKFDVATRQITRKPKATASATPEKKG
jgi:hypothetical protein